MADERLRYRLEARRSNATAPRRNRYRESKSGQTPWNCDEWHDLVTGEEMAEEGDVE